MTTPRAWQPCPPICAPRPPAAADTAVRKALTDCMAQKELAPVGCPFSSYNTGATALNVVWSSTTEPQVIPNLDPSGQLHVDGTAELAVQYVESATTGRRRRTRRSPPT